MRNDKGQFSKGNTLGGRTKGSRNKTTLKIRDAFLDFVEANLSKMQEDFEKLEPKDRFKYLFDMSKFILPSLKAIELHDALAELTEDQFNELLTQVKAEYYETRSIKRN